MGRAYKTSYAGPERFTAFGGTFCKIERSAAPELYALALRFPEAFSRALRHAGLPAARRAQGRPARFRGLRASWPELSRDAPVPAHGHAQGRDVEPWTVASWQAFPAQAAGSDTGAFPGASG